MKSLHIIVFFLACFCSYSQNSQQPLLLKPNGEKRALIVGISDYNEANLKLNYAKSDAELFKDYLSKVEKLDDDNIYFLNSNDEKSDAYAGALSIYNALDKLLENSKPEDIVYIYFAGHGDVVKKISKYEGYLLAIDANGGRNYKGTGGVVSLSDLNEYVGVLTNQGTQVVMVLDACHSGFAFKESSQKNLQTLNNAFLNSTRFLSCEPNQFSYESADLEHGYFTYYLVLGLMGAADSNDSNLQYIELSQFLYDNVYNESEEKQTPLIVSQNKRDTIKPINPKDKLQAMEAIKTSSKVKDILASRSIDSKPSKSIEINNPIIKRFNLALENENYYGTKNSALEIYNTATTEKSLPEQALKKLKFSLIKVLSTSAQLLINYYINGYETLPSGAEFKEQSEHLKVCLDLMDASYYMKQRLYTSQLFLEAYTIIRNENYSNYNTAKQTLKKALDLEPRAAYIHNALGILYNYEESFDSAYYHYNQAKNLIPTWVYPINNIGTNYYDQYQYQNAKKAYQNALKLENTYITPLNNLGAISESQGKYNEAESYYLQAKQPDGQYSSTTLKNLGVLYENKGNIKKAIDYYEKALKKNPKNVYTYYTLSDLLISEAIDIQRSEKLLKKAIELEPYFSKGHAIYADFLRRYPKNENSYQQALELYDFAIKNNPYYEWAYAGKGWLLHKQDLKEEALLSFNKAIETNPNKPKAYYNLASYYNNALNNKKLSEEYYLKAIEQDSFYLPAYERLVGLYNDNEQEQESLIILQKLLKWNANTPDIWNLLGNTYFKLGDYNKSLETYKKTIQVDSTYAKGLTNLAYSFMKTENYTEATKYLKQAVLYNPYKNNLKSFSLLLLTEGRKKKRSGNLAEAELILNQAYTLDLNYNTAFSLAESYYLNDNANKAIEIIKSITIEELSKTRKIKFLELACKIAIDLKLKEEATTYLNNLKPINPRPNYILEALVNNLNKNKEAVSNALSKVNPLLLKEQFLKTKYSKTAINNIQKLKE